jgi:hypothetical protein
MDSHEAPIDADAIVEGLLFGESRVDQSANWAELGDEDAALARGAIRKAQEIRAASGDTAADKYLEGIADVVAFQRRQALAHNFHFPNDLAAGM